MSLIVNGQQAEDAPKIEFPCDYPIRVMGEKCEEFLARVIDIVEKHACIPDKTCIRMRDSSKGRFVSALMVITATGPEQLHALHVDLRQYSAVKMVL